MRAFTIAPKAKIFVYNLPVNMGCSFPKLSEFVEDKLKKKVQSGDLYLFCNKKRNYLKILYWANSGYCIFAKRLPIGTFEEASGEEITLGDMHKLVEHITHKEKLRAKSLRRAA